jgi:hypothetical protein
MSYLDLFQFNPLKSENSIGYNSSDYETYYKLSSKGNVSGDTKSKKLKTTENPKSFKKKCKPTKKQVSKKIIKKGRDVDIDNKIWNSSYKSIMIRRPITPNIVASRKNSGNYNKNLISSISLENYIGSKKTKKQKAGSLTCCGQITPDFDSSKLTVFTTWRQNLEKLIPFR